jgi:hypothetical protein
MNFLDAKKIVSPDSPVVPGSKEHKDILTLMRQSGRVFAEDNVLPVPKQITTLRPFTDRPQVINDRKVSKKQFQELFKFVSKDSSVSARKASFFPKVAPTPGMSKKQWLNKISRLNISDGSGEEVQAISQVEGGAGENKGSS